MIKDSLWIRAKNVEKSGKCPVFVKRFDSGKPLKATLCITAKGVYVAILNKERIGSFIMAPGFTEYKYRHQYQEYDVTDMIKDGENEILVTVSAGWYAGRIVSRKGDWTPEIIAELRLSFDDETVVIKTDESWMSGESALLFSDIYDGEIYDARKTVSDLIPVIVNEDGKTDNLIPQEGETVEEQEVFKPVSIFTTPKGERVIDFGQNLVGYPKLKITAKEGEKVSLSFAEVLDKDGNFYNENYRSAKCLYDYTCRDGYQEFKPQCTFYGYRYIRIDEFPESASLTEDTFESVAVYSKLRKTGNIVTSNPKLNQLFSNILWGQRSNFLDIPTDCPQRDERRGWTGDAQVFCKTAGYNFDVYKFFKKWLYDMDVARKEFGSVGFMIPGNNPEIAAAWSDAAVIVPWQIYLTYGDKDFLNEMLDMMVSHIEAIKNDSEHEYTWRGGKKLYQFGDWLATDTDSKEGRDADYVGPAYNGATRFDFLQAAFYAYDISIVAKALKVLGKDNKEYLELFRKVKERFQKDFPTYETQTEFVLALRFGLTPNPEKTVKLLAEKIHTKGDRLSTGFVGTPHILHALSENGETELAYTLLLQERYPSWLNQVNLGATTMWEHWDSIDENGEMWSPKMNSFNHYAYGAVADWIYEVAAGIKQADDSAGFEKLVIAPHPDKRLEFLEATYETKYGLVHSKWQYKDNGIFYEIEVPSDAKIIINGKEKYVSAGSYSIKEDF